VISYVASSNYDEIAIPVISYVISIDATRQENRCKKPVQNETSAFAEMIDSAHYGYKLDNFKRCWNCGRFLLVKVNVETKLKQSVNLKNLSSVCIKRISLSLFERVVTSHDQLWKHERKRPTPVRRRFSRTNAIIVRAFPGGWVPGMKMRSVVVLYKPSAFHHWSAQGAALLLLSDELISCAAGTNGCFDLRYHAVALSRQVSTEGSRCLGSMARRARDSVAPLRRSSAG